MSPSRLPPCNSNSNSKHTHPRTHSPTVLATHTHPLLNHPTTFIDPSKPPHKYTMNLTLNQENPNFLTYPIRLGIPTLTRQPSCCDTLKPYLYTKLNSPAHTVPYATHPFDSNPHTHQHLYTHRNTHIHTLRPTENQPVTVEPNPPWGPAPLLRSFIATPQHPPLLR